MGDDGDARIFEALHRFCEDVAADALHDVLDEFRAVALDALPFPRPADAQVRDGRAAKRVHAERGRGVGELAAARELDEEPAAPPAEDERADHAVDVLPDRALHGAIDGLPVRDDVRIRRPPGIDERRELRLAETEVQRPHRLQRADRAAVAERELRDLALLPQLRVRAVLFHFHAEHALRRRAVDVAAVRENLLSPRFACELCEHARLDGGKIRDDKRAARTRDERRAHELRQHLGDGAELRPDRRRVTRTDERPCPRQIFKAVAPQILQLDDAPAPAPRARRSVKLEHAARPAVRGHRRLHRLILLDRRLREREPQGKHCLHWLFGVRERPLHVFLREARHRRALRCKPRFQLRDGIRIL